MKRKDTNSKPVVTRDMPSRGEGVMETYHFPKVGNIQASSLAEAQVKAEAKRKALNSNNEDNKN